MKQRPPIPALLMALCVALGALAAPTLAAPAAAPHKRAKVAVFEVCKRGCRFDTIQKGVNAAGSFQQRKRNRRTRALVAVRPGKYVEGVVVDATRRKREFDGLRIEGTAVNRRKTILEGRGAAGRVRNGIEAIGVDGIVLRNLWARDYRANGFFVHAAAGGGCDGFEMDNLLASGNRFHGLFAKGCRGGRIVDSSGLRDGAAAFAVAETPCDSGGWSDHGAAPRPCQRKPRWTLLRNDRAYENALGFSGTNSKYVKVIDSAFYDNGAGIAAVTLDGASYEPNGWSLFERDDVFWNNYNQFLSASKVDPVPAGLGAFGATPINYPTGVGFVLYGGSHNIVRRNNIFGNYKWGVASFSGPGETYVANEGDDAKNLDNEIAENNMGREGADPNGEFDFWNDGTGGGNCWGANSANSTFAPADGEVPLSRTYSLCPQAQLLADQVSSLDLSAGLQLDPGDPSDPATLLGYLGTYPPRDQQCSWVRRLGEHPRFQKFKPSEIGVRPGELSC